MRCGAASSVLILDEPTSMLTPQGVHHLGEVMKRLRDKGVAIIFITHKLREACALGDRISVLRLGRLVGGIDRAELAAMTEQQMTDKVIGLMFGKDGQSEPCRTPCVGRPDGPARLQAELIGARRNCSGSAAWRRRRSPANAPCATSASIFGREKCWVLPASTAMARSTWRKCSPASVRQSPARIVLRGVDITRGGVPDRRQRGIAYVTDERHGEGTVADILGRDQSGRSRRSARRRFGGAASADGSRIHRMRPRADPAPRHPHALGAHADRQALGRQRTEGAAGARADARADVVVFNKPTYGLDLQNTQLRARPHRRGRRTRRGDDRDLQRSRRTGRRSATASA